LEEARAKIIEVVKELAKARQIDKFIPVNKDAFNLAYGKSIELRDNFNRYAVFYDALPLAINDLKKESKTAYNFDIHNLKIEVRRLQREKVKGAVQGGTGNAETLGLIGADAIEAIPALRNMQSGDDYEDVRVAASDAIVNLDRVQRRDYAAGAKKPAATNTMGKLLQKTMQQTEKVIPGWKLAANPDGNIENYGGNTFAGERLRVEAGSRVIILEKMVEYLKASQKVVVSKGASAKISPEALAVMEKLFNLILESNSSAAMHKLDSMIDYLGALPAEKILEINRQFYGLPDPKSMLEQLYTIWEAKDAKTKIKKIVTLWRKPVSTKANRTRPARVRRMY